MVSCYGRPSIPAKIENAREAGFTYLGVLFAVALAGIALAGAGVLWHMENRREKEKELLFVGDQYRLALSSYYNKSPGALKQYPQKLEDLLLDTRFPNPVRHLRRLYREPMMADGQWELIRQQGRIFGVASRSQETPIKVAGFKPEQESFENAVSYSAWRFTAVVGGGGAGPTEGADSGGGLPEAPTR